jgi:CrcB protein
MKGLSAIFWVALGGSLGAVARYGVARLAGRLFGASFPYGTLIINISGSFVLGFLATILAEKTMPYSDQMRLAGMTGFLGAYTTFSTYEYESNALLEGGEWMLAGANLIGSMVAGLIALRLGIALGKK